MEKFTKPLFIENQSFNQFIFWFFLNGMTLFFIIAIIQQVLLLRSFGDNPMPNGMLVVFALLTIGINIFFRLIKLRTIVDDNHLQFTFFPFKRHQFKWKEIESVQLVNYGFIGFGIRMFSKYGTAYNIRGSSGLSIVLKDGRKFLLGTQSEIELMEALSKIEDIKLLPSK